MKFQHFINHRRGTNCAHDVFFRIILPALVCFLLRFEFTTRVDHSVHSLCATEERQRQTHVNKLVDNVTRKRRITRGGKRPSRPRPRTAGVDSGSELASVKRGTISCPNASEKKSTQGTRANIFSTQIGYSNYPRLFNLATRLRALFQVPSTVAEIGEFGLVGGFSGGKGWQSFPQLHHFVHDGEKKKTAASACRNDGSGRDFAFLGG